VPMQALLIIFAGVAVCWLGTVAARVRFPKRNLRA
jgi:hypothetical protein